MLNLRLLLGRVALALALACGAICALGGLAGLAGRFSGWLDIAAHGAPVWAAGGIGAWLLALAAPHGFPRRLARTLGVLAVLAAAPLVLIELLAPRGPTAPPQAPCPSWISMASSRPSCAGPLSQPPRLYWPMRYLAFSRSSSVTADSPGFVAVPAVEAPLARAVFI